MRSISIQSSGILVYTTAYCNFCPLESDAGQEPGSDAGQEPESDASRQEPESETATQAISAAVEEAKK